MVSLLILGVTSACVSWALIRSFRRWAANKKKLIDQPNERSLHTRPMVRGGGVGIVLVTLTFWGGLQFGPFRVPSWTLYSTGPVALIMGGALLIAAISWMDDVRNGLSPGLRLAVHVIAAGLAVQATGGWDLIALPFLGIIDIKFVGSVIALLWVVGLVNAYNFMDGIDGIAGVQALTAAGGWLAVGLLSGNGTLSVAGTLIGASAIGFLIHNWPPAKIFLGDVGSAFLGYSFAVISLCASRLHIGPAMGRIPVAGALMVAPFILDSVFTFLRRLMKGERLSQAHRSHLYQRLVVSGLSHRAVALAYAALGLAGSVAGVAFILIQDQLAADIISSLVALAVLAFLLFWTTARERMEPRKI